MKTCSKPITDQEILNLIVCGHIKFMCGQLWKFHNTKRSFYLVVATRHDKNKRYRYNIKIGKRQRTIQRAKLHWMIKHKQLVPDGYDVDHKDHDRYNDDPDNLQLRDQYGNRSDNWSDGQFAEVANFFDDIAKGQNGDF